MPRFFSALLEEIPAEVARLAFDLHCQHPRNLSIEILNPMTISSSQVDELFRIENNELIFISVEARNHCTAVHSYRMFGDFDSTVDYRKVFDEAQQLGDYEIGETDYASGRFLGLVSQKRNILHAAIEIINNSNASSVFNVLRNIGNTLPFLAAVSMKDLVDLAAVQHSKTAGDMGAGMFFSQVSDYLSSHPLQAKALYELVRENMVDANTDLYVTALIGLAMAERAREAIDLALNDADSDYIDLSASALWVLGRMSHHWGKEPDLKNSVQETLKAMVHHPNSTISFQALNALSIAAVSQPELMAELLAHAKPDNQIALQKLGDFVFRNFAIIKDHPSLTDILLALTDLEIGHTHDFDYVLSQLIKNGIHDQQVYGCLTTWMLKHPINEDEDLIFCFNHSFRELVDKPLLSELITRWLISDEKILGFAFSNLISHLWSHGVRQPVFSKEIIDTAEGEDFKYLARRLLGWTFFEEPLLSLTFSLLETKDAQQRTFSWVHTLLVTDVGRNYPLATQEAIREKLSSATPEVEKLLQATQAELIAYADTIKQLPIRNELYPPIPMRIRHAMALKRAKEQREAGEKANEQSIFQQICTRIPLKAGSGSFSIYAGRISEINRLASHSFFVTLPAQSVIDPLNDEITRRGFRSAKRGDE